MLKIDADSLTCKVVSMQGQEMSVHATSSWRIWHLKAHVRAKWRIPEYEQHFAKGNDTVRSDDLLRDLLFTCEGNQLTLSLVRARGPECFSRSRTSELWEAFLAFSRDSGDTMDGTQVAQVAKMGGLFRIADSVACVPNISASVTFLQLLTILAALRTPRNARQTWRPTEGEESSRWTLDLGRTQLAPRRRSDELNNAGVEAADIIGNSDVSESSASGAHASSESRAQASLSEGLTE
eukprot:TRINITY_DN5970_c0_g1_i1.p1 TRINITY_DN5970_c0_g1~~TRINITY_DN5970_c0_g1_i1.p1  ORF type:complete len:237 (-),score=31.97 TRINITY_DN5970_c0_g1_i1:231-941(-)